MVNTVRCCFVNLVAVARMFENVRPGRYGRNPDHDTHQNDKRAMTLRTKRNAPTRAYSVSFWKGIVFYRLGWMTPIVLARLVFGALVLLSTTTAVPFL